MATLVMGCFAGDVEAQFAPAAGQSGSTALRADSTCFVNWAKRCSIQRGLRQINLHDSGYATVGTAAAAEGPAATNGVVSLGDGGIATLTFNPPITDGNGFDFAIFENTFLDTFLELAFVEVSTDSQSWARFPSKSLTQTQTQTGAFGFTQPTQIHNLAGKYRHPYGTPFDLKDLAMMSNIRVEEIRYVRVIDVIGCIDPSIGSKDIDGRMINDPFPTPFPSSGFDLDAVGVINQLPSASVISPSKKPLFGFDPNQQTLISNATEPLALEVYNAKGQRVSACDLSPSEPLALDLAPGTYWVRHQHHSIKIIITSTR
jgi:hypothetical protein